jgi:hypothetical protein
MVLCEAIFSFVGPGHRLYCALVSTMWLELYERVPSRELITVNADGRQRKTRVTASMTLGSAVFASVSRLRLAHECGLELENPSYYTLPVAAGRWASIETLRAAHALGLAWSQMLLQGVALSGDVSKLQYLHTQQKCDIPPDICQQASRSGSIGMVKYLVELHGRAAYDVNTLRAAAEAGHVNVVQYLRSQNCQWDLTVSEAAAAAGHRDVLLWLKQKGFCWTESVSNAALRTDNLDLLKWLIDEGCPWTNQSLISGALYSSNLGMLKYAHELGAALDANTMQKAARQSSLEVVQYLHEVGCLWNTQTCGSAAFRKDPTVFKWLYTQGCPCDIIEVLQN